MKCVTKGLKGAFKEVQVNLKEEKSIRKSMAPLIETYTCGNQTLPTTTPISTTTWSYKRSIDGVLEPPRKVSVMVSRKAAVVHVVEDFITEEECREVEREGRRKGLMKASVADEGGGSTFSPNRKALQAGISVNWNLEESGDLISRLSRRVFSYTNQYTNYGLSHEGQEDIMTIQYEGRGVKDTEPDRYMPHCDGDCEGDEFRVGSRVATMVIYCEVPEVGGATNFRQSNVHIKPKKLAATWFKYADITHTPGGDPVGVMDSGYTEHSGCPVLKGSKKIVTQWMRLGVSEEVKWDSFNTMGVSKKTVEELLKQ